MKRLFVVVAVVAVVFVSIDALAQQYTIIDLGKSMSLNNELALNDLGDVVGMCYFSSGDYTRW